MEETLWKSQRGDEWWYRNEWWNADASLNGMSKTFTIETISTRSARLTKPGLYQLLWKTWQQFHEMKIFIVTDPSLLKMLEELKTEGRIEFQVLNLSSRNTEIRLTNIGD
ncbi:hypothetical protein Pan153_01300 [Gimesia panareensis]|uniref:Uncharacterized protein n=1 Tax=Gimesia panareensis TaxID=2527978 RepID=A0A518FGP7_9PLAN|nr:hypothetical protein [Gimesia panareensis]QDV15516.1 hypothetical protein Pan153_01300 [Gimesia panareensis]